MLQKLSKLLQVLQSPNLELPNVKNHRFSTLSLILAFLTEAPGASLLANQILNRVKVVDAEWAIQFEDSDDIEMLSNQLKRKDRVRMSLTRWAQDWLIPLSSYMVRSESHRNPESAMFSPNEGRGILKAELWLRDGCRTPFLGLIDPQAPKDEVVMDPSLPHDFSLFTDIGHILPFWIGSRPVVYSYLKTFGNLSIPFEDIQAALSRPPNSAVFDLAWRNLFHKFAISIQYDPAMDQYILRSYDPGVPPVVSEHKNRPLLGLHAGLFTDMEYRLSGEFCNIHHAICKILHTSGAGNAIDDILNVEVGAKEMGLLCLYEDFYEVGSDHSEEESYSFLQLRYKRAGIDLLDRKLGELAMARSMCLTPDIGWKRSSTVYDILSS
ncbi:hypothetical protein CVT26_015879 [Gymnopilus dilepis]|uniref:Uncharacterized protein n=1 Tax=Gymnopilus dilepis TaxID=231916 RepID=A0A409XYG7_9AGAR|nr:hypothetical protein CVT26_015879 [Gymnopilus dilepis]